MRDIVSLKPQKKAFNYQLIQEMIGKLMILKHHVVSLFTVAKLKKKRPWNPNRKGGNKFKIKLL